MVKELLMSTNYWVLNKSIVKEFGIETAFLLINLAEAETTLSDEEGWFYQTSKTLEELTGLSNHKQTLCINQLIEIGALTQQNKGMPMKRYFKINYETIQKLVFKNFKNLDSKNLNTSFQKNEELVFKNFKTINNISINNLNKQNNINTKKEKETDFDKMINEFTEHKELKESIYEFIKMRKTIKKPMTNRALKLMLNKINKFSLNEQMQIDILNQSILNCWQDIYELKQQNNFKTKENQENKKPAFSIENLRG